MNVLDSRRRDRSTPSSPQPHHQTWHRKKLHSTRVKPSGGVPVIHTRNAYREYPCNKHHNIVAKLVNMQPPAHHSREQPRQFPYPTAPAATPAPCVVTVYRATRFMPLTAIASISPSASCVPSHHTAPGGSLSHPPAIRPARRRS